MKTIPLRQLVLALLLPVLLGAMATAALAQDKSVAVTVKATGEVLVKSGAGESPLKSGTRLDDGDQVRTGPDGRAVLVFTDDKSQLKLTPNTKVVLHARRGGGRTDKEVEMSQGTLWSKVTRQQGEFRIATPTSVASVKGTAWWTKTGEDGTDIITEEGIVGLTSRETNQEVNVMSGQTGHSDGEASTVRPTSDADQEGLERGELRRVVVPIQDGETRRELIIEYYE